MNNGLIIEEIEHESGVFVTAYSRDGKPTGYCSARTKTGDIPNFIVRANKEECGAYGLGMTLREAVLEALDKLDCLKGRTL
jgi:hypothetical protein